MRKILLFLTLLSTTAISNVGNAQLCLGNDTTVCAGSALTINNCSGTIPGNNQGIVLNNPTSVSLSDDSWSGAVPIGFNFNFYGNNFTQCVIGSNCILSFNLANANGYCPWSLGAVGPLPNPGFAAAMNTVMPCYQDINPSAWTSPNGAIQYQTIGTAPNRMFVVLWKDINFYSCTSICNYLSCILYESTNEIEVHIGDKPLCPSWNSGLGIQGTENNNGTVAHITPGRNNTQWSANQEGMRWTPTSPANTTNYTIAQIPYILITSPNTSFQWENTLGQTFPYNNGVLSVNPVLPGTNGYFLSGSACGASLGGVSDTSWVTGVASSVTATGTDDICSAGLGTVTANPQSGIPPYTYNWPGLGATTQTVTGVTAGTYTVEMWDSLGCMSTAQVTIGDTPAAFSGSTTLVSCPGGNDGTATAEMIPVIGNITYQWDDPLMQTTQTATGLTAGTYNCVVTSDIGCSETVTVTVTEIPGMIANIIAQTDVTCNSGNDGMIQLSVSQGTGPYSYSWDNSSSTTNIANDLVAGTHTCTITDDNGCIITISGTIGEPAPLDITFLTPDTQICPEDDITLNVSGTGGSTAYTFTWFENGTQIGTGSQITVDPEYTNTQYCVVLSEACGSPTDQECNLIYFPTPIIPNAEPDEFERCIDDATFAFFNTSTNGGEIATTYWDFGDQNLIALSNGDDSISMTFNEVGSYDLIMTVTSIYGCVYTDTVTNIMEVKPRPTADFYFSTNPATIFESSVMLQDKSSVDVIYWNWYSPFSTPSSSNLENPVMVFPEEAGEYPVTLIVENELGCFDTITYVMQIIEDILFFAPNTFTPDGDEHNQIWKPEISGIDIYDFELFIFNRWGEMIWESHDPNVGWDGTYHGVLVPQGTYVWKATVKDPFKDKRKTFNGTINLIK